MTHHHISTVLFSQKKTPRYTHGVNEEGTTITRTLASALPDTSNVEGGLNCNVVGGNSCAFRIVSIGCGGGNWDSVKRSLVRRQRSIQYDVRKGHEHLRFRLKNPMLHRQPCYRSCY